MLTVITVTPVLMEVTCHSRGPQGGSTGGDDTTLSTSGSLGLRNWTKGGVSLKFSWVWPWQDIHNEVFRAPGKPLSESKGNKARSTMSWVFSAMSSQIRTYIGNILRSYTRPCFTPESAKESLILSFPTCSRVALWSGVHTWRLSAPSC